MTKTRSLSGCLAAAQSRNGAAFLARAVAVCSVLTACISGVSGCSGSSSSGANGTGGQGSSSVAVSTGGTSAGIGGASASIGGASADIGGTSAGIGGTSAGISGASAGIGGASAGIGGASAGIGGTSASIGGASASSGGTSAGIGGASANIGGASANIGGTSAGIGGASASIGGASAGIGGASASIGGASASIGGASAGIGGASAGIGGASASIGGASASIGGAVAAGGATVGTVGGSDGDASVLVELSGYDVAVNPYGTNPLVAVVNLRQIEANRVQRVQVVVSGQDGGQDLVRTYSATDTDLVVNIDTSDLSFPEAGYHVPVIGLYADRENTVRILVDLDPGRVDLTLKITTSLSKPDETAWVPSIQVKTAIAEQMEPGWTVAEISIEPNPNPTIVFVDWTRTIAFDERGAIRWALRLNLPKGETFTLRRAINGNFLTGSLDTIVEVTKLGRILHSFQLSDYTLNHEIVQIGSGDNGEGVPSGTKSEHFGNILVLASKNGASTIQDHIVELDSDTGKVQNEWDLTKILDPTRKTYINAEKWDISQNGDWFHDNGIAYSTADESIIVSGRHQGVAKIRRDGTLVWLLAPHKGWNAPQSSKLLTAVSATQAPYADAVQLGNQAAGTASAPEFDWPFGQHSPTLLPNGDLLLFDNGASRHFTGFCGSFSRAVIYRVDATAMTTRQIGQFVFSKAESSCYCSNTHLLPVTRNIFIQPAQTSTNIAIAREVTTQVAADGTIAFDKVVFDATVNMSIIDTSHWYVYSFRGHRWMF